MSKNKIKSFCKINLYLKVVKKLNSGYHNINSLITFCDLYDIIYINKIKGKKDKIFFSGKFGNGISKKFNTITKLLSLIRNKNFLLNQAFKINIKKNIPHGSGLGGGSSNAATLLNYLNFKMKLKLKNKEIKKIARRVGFDVPINLIRKNTLLTGKNDELLRLNKKFFLNILIVYPNLICSTKKMYKLNTKKSSLKKNNFLNTKNKKNLINCLKKENNDLEKIVIKNYPKVGKIIDLIKSQKGCYFSRITGSGSACFGIFSNKRNAIFAQRLIKLNYPKYWTAVSRTI